MLKIVTTSRLFLVSLHIHCFVLSENLGFSSDGLLWLLLPLLPSMRLNSLRSAMVGMSWDLDNVSPLPFSEMLIHHGCTESEADGSNYILLIDCCFSSTSFLVAIAVHHIHNEVRGSFEGEVKLIAFAKAMMMRKQNSPLLWLSICFRLALPKRWDCLIWMCEDTPSWLFRGHTAITNHKIRVYYHKIHVGNAWRTAKI